MRGDRQNTREPFEGEWGGGAHANTTEPFKGSGILFCDTTTFP